MNDIKTAECLLFDLDGTLSDNSEGIIGGVLYALDKYGIHPTDREDLKKFIGPPLAGAFSKYYGFSEEEAKKVVEAYRVYFRQQGLFENKMYDGIPEMLKKLKNAGKRLFIATSKPEEFAVKITEKFGIADLFEYIGGSTFDGSREKKNDVIEYVMERCGVDGNKAVMIGDRHHDIEGGKSCGIKTVGVLYGFGSREELSSAGADFIVSSPVELAELFI